ncbi:MAG TPA: DUF2235 domain-containing protein [Thermoanaerobaculia bacterium]|nr:DUF2235 domain-containing protein [Thermoanaerobaculia bacterium]
MSKNIVVCLDGTNDTYVAGGVNTNVGRIYEASINDDRQVKFYSDGVGSGGHVLSAATGYGVDVRIERGYQFILDYYEDGDKIFLFGFSRGAFETRSVAGMIHQVGLIRKDSGKTTDDAYTVYTQSKANPAAAAAFKAENSREVKIHFVGVWDTVGALGLPIGLTLTTIAPPDYHDVELGPHIVNAVHAVSIDEERWDFQPTYFNPALVQPGQTLEQVFFPGVHSDVGGGYSDDHRLGDITLAWLAQHAVDKGLLLADTSILTCPDDACYGMLHDSFGGVYQFRSKFFRPIDFNGRIHSSAKKRIEDAANSCKPSAYKPRNIDKNNTGYDWVG